MMLRSPSLSTPVAAEQQDAAVLQSLQVALQTWATFDWVGKKTQLDKASAVTREQKDQSLAARKLLAETTKAFKKSVKSMELAAASLKVKAPDSDNAAVKAMDNLAKDCRQLSNHTKKKSIISPVVARLRKQHFCHFMHP
jgi:multidrug efflux pump subunit AcrA (membrane-fusion protein)